MKTAAETTTVEHDGLAAQKNDLMSFFTRRTMCRRGKNDSQKAGQVAKLEMTGMRAPVPAEKGMAWGEEQRLFTGVPEEN